VWTFHQLDLENHDFDQLCLNISMDIVWNFYWTLKFEMTLKATSYIRSKVCDHCALRSLVGWKGQDCSSSLHTRRWRPKSPKKSSRMKSLRGCIHVALVMFHDVPKFATCPLPSVKPYAYSNVPYRWYIMPWMRIKGPYNYMVTALGQCMKWPNRCQFYLNL
jgi:hypothetical protein